MQEHRAEAQEDLLKAEAIKAELESLMRLTETYPAGHDVRAALEGCDLKSARAAVEEHINHLRRSLNP